jgi:hypothetical protein
MGEISLYRKSREEERKCLARLTHGYMDGGAGICAEQYQNFISKKSSFLLSIKEVLSGWLSVLPCCITALSLTLIALASKP